jgi:hypothetical protein
MDKLEIKPLRQECDFTKSVEPEFSIFSDITKDASNSLDILSHLLFARGFLVELTDAGIIMSDNAYDESRSVEYNIQLKQYKKQPRYNSDWKDMLEIAGDMIEVDGEHIISCNNNFRASTLYYKLFLDKPRIGFEVGWYPYWARFSHFKRHRFFSKVRTVLLDPFIALYVKALGSLTLATVMSCQGHVDEGYSEAFVQFAGRYDVAFHEALWMTDSCLRQIHSLIWHTRHSENSSGLYICLNKRASNDTIYASLIRAGRYLYEHRVEIRNKKNHVADVMAKSEKLQELNGSDLSSKMVQLVNEV